MERYILFRPRKIHSLHSGRSHITHRGRGSDFSDIAPYITGDDTRDISWKHSARTGSIVKKIRIDEENFPIYIVNTDIEGNTFSTERYQISTSQFIDKIKSSIYSSGKKYHYTIKNISIDEVKNTTNSMLFYISSDIEGSHIKTLGGIAKYNDLIMLHVFHPSEIQPEDDFIFGGLGIDISEYQREFEKKRNSLEKYIYSIDAGYILLTTDVSIIDHMNRFFRYRYQKS